MTLEELVEAVNDRLQQAGVSAPPGRARARVDGRTVRYYTTVGLVDPPLDHRGRVAHYGSHHVRQLLAIKRLQAEGASLQQIAMAVTAASETTLDALGGGSPPPSRHRHAPVAARHLLEIPLGGDVTLTIPAHDPAPLALDIAALRRAAAPVLQLVDPRLPGRA